MPGARSGLTGRHPGQASGIKDLLISNGGELTITDSDASTIRKIDAAQTGSAVNIGVSQFADGTQVRGGTGGNDTLTFNDYARISQADWQGIENAAFRDGGELDASAAAGLNAIRQLGSGPLTVSNITAQTLNVYTDEAGPAGRTASGKTAVNGEIDNIIWHTCGMKERPATVDALFSSNASQVNIAADGMDAYITSLGAVASKNPLDLRIDNGQDVEITGIYGGSNISASLACTGNTTIHEMKAAGALKLTASGQNLLVPANIEGVSDSFIGASVDLDFSGLSGFVAGDGLGDLPMMLAVETLAGSLNYQGSQGCDRLFVGSLTVGTTSSIATGDGYDLVIVQTLKSICDGQTATLNVDLGSNENNMRVFNMNQTGNLVINVENAAAGKTTVYTECAPAATITTVEKANLALQAVDAGFQLAADAAISNGFFEHEASAYWLAAKFNGANPYAITLVAAEDAPLSVLQDDSVYREGWGIVN